MWPAGYLANAMDAGIGIYAQKHPGVACPGQMVRGDIGDFHGVPALFLVVLADAPAAPLT
jgi:hypothetical protein